MSGPMVQKCGISLEHSITSLPIAVISGCRGMDVFLMDFEDIVFIECFPTALPIAYKCLSSLNLPLLYRDGAVDLLHMCVHNVLEFCPKITPTVRALYPWNGFEVIRFDSDLMEAKTYIIFEGFVAFFGSQLMAIFCDFYLCRLLIGLLRSGLKIIA